MTWALAGLWGLVMWLAGGRHERAKQTARTAAACALRDTST